MRQNERKPDMKRSKLKILGITGGIGSGKSSVCLILARHGARVLDADAVARKVMEPGGLAYDGIIRNFGKGILTGSGSIDRKVLAQKVFGSRDQLDALNRLVHPCVLREMKAAVRVMEITGDPGLVVLDVPIPVKEGFLDLCEEIWVVEAEDELRIRRVMQRSQLSREQVLKRMQAQPSREAYAGMADRIIPNNGSMEELKIRVEKALQSFMSAE